MTPMTPEEKLKQMTLEEKVLLVTGTRFMYTNPVPRLSVPSLRFSDGPHGLRVQSEPEKLENGVEANLPATAFPPAATVASSWDPANAYRTGSAIADEALFYGINVVLGPGANIKRNPRCGRNFEYYSEDPLLSGKMAAAEIRGLEDKRIGACLKHFAFNNAENFRFVGDSIVDSRAAREIYLESFRIAVTEGRPRSVMCAYNKVNGTFCSENKWLLTDVLRDEWGFEGIVMTDWGAVADKVKAISSGDDLDMPGDTVFCRRVLYDAIKSGELDTEHLDKAVLGILKTVESFSEQAKKEDPEFEVHHALAGEIAADCAVLLKNDGTLPLAEDEPLMVIGDLFRIMRYQGSGSSMITPALLTTPEDAFKARGVRYEFAPGYIETETEPDRDEIELALEMAEKHEKVLVFAGLPDYTEGEAGDREHLMLPDNQLALIDALIGKGKKITLVLFGGSPFELPFAGEMSAILNMYLPGQNGGDAVCKLLFGDISPSGRLAETWPASYLDVPFAGDFSCREAEIYKESIFAGYRYYATYGKPVLFPFGFGLSYTSFSYSGLSVAEDEEGFTVSCSVANTGSRGGKEVVQLYVSGPSSDVLKPKRELKAFTKLSLAPGETRNAELRIDFDDLKYFNANEDRFVLEPGTYLIQICKDSETVILEKAVEVKGEDAEPPYSEKALAIYTGDDILGMTDRDYEEAFGISLPEELVKVPLTMESRLTDFKQTFFGRIILGAALSYLNGLLKKARKTKNPAERSGKIKAALFTRKIMETNSMRSLSMSSSGRLPFNVAEGIVHIANGKLFKGIAKLAGRIKDPSKKA